jgi:hypothetical protein
VITRADQKAWTRHYKRGWWAGVQRRAPQVDDLDEWLGCAYLTGHTAGAEAWDKADAQSKQVVKAGARRQKRTGS